MLKYSYDIKVESAYIIRIEGNEASEKMAARCAESCERVGQPYKFFQAVDGTKGELVYPKDVHPAINLLKWSNTSLTLGEMGCILTHFLLWVKCIEMDKPIVVLEHDAIMLAPYLEHPFFSVLSYLGNAEQVLHGWKTYFPMPPHGQVNENYRFMLRTHAYAIDSTMARQLVAKLIKNGICQSADVFMRFDEFAIIQQGVYAYNMDGAPTIIGREGREDENTLIC